MTARAEAALPLEVLEMEAMTPSQALAKVGLQGLKQLDAILAQPLDLDDLKQQRLIGDLALGSIRLWIKASEAEFRQQRSDQGLAQLLELVRAAADGDPAIEAPKKLTKED